MTVKRFTTDNGSNEDVCLVDNITKKEYESNFNDIVDLMNRTWEQTQRFEKYNKELTKENEQLKQDNTGLMKLLENQSIIIQELHSKILEFELKDPITLTKEDLELMGKAISYYTHGRCGE